MARTVAVTGGSGKLGRAVVTALIGDGWIVVNFDRVPGTRQPGPLHPHRPHRLRPGRRGLLRHRRGPPRRRCRRPSCRHPRRDLRPERGNLRQQPPLDVPRLPSRQAIQDPQPGLGVQRDFARLPVQTTRRRTCHSTRTSRPHPRSCTPLPKISKRRWPDSTAAGTRIRR